MNTLRMSNKTIWFWCYLKKKAWMIFFQCKLMVINLSLEQFRKENHTFLSKYHCIHIFQITRRYILIFESSLACVYGLPLIWRVYFSFPGQDDQQYFCGLIFPIILYPIVKSIQFCFVNSTFIYWTIISIFPSFFPWVLICNDFSFLAKCFRIKIFNQFYNENSIFPSVHTVKTLNFFKF